MLDRETPNRARCSMPRPIDYSLAVFVTLWLLIYISSALLSRAFLRVVL
jgi:hypothetical protein